MVRKARDTIKTKVNNRDNIMTRLFQIFIITLLAGIAALSPAKAQQRPDMYVVIFRADWCAPCKIVEPNLARALATLRDPGLEVVTIDITTPPRSEQSAHLAFDRNIVAQYNQWYGVTGFAAMIDADTKQTLGCVNMMYDANSMATHIKNLKTYAMANKPSFDVTCPAPNAAVR